ncbi:MAG: hypothetical protein KIT59_08765 [Nitrosomonas sp.]|nr:hypothetical protein [Nitrosomonas sp.]
MPTAMSYPGVYIKEIPSGIRTITRVKASIAAFIGPTQRGPLDTEGPVRIQSFSEFERDFGGLWRQSPLTYAVNQFFQNGGSAALIIRVVNNGAAATGIADTLNLVASSPGKWGEQLRLRIDHNTRPEIGVEELFNLTIRDTITGVTERFLNVSVLPLHTRYVGKVLEQESKLVRLVAPTPTTRPAATPDAIPGIDPMTATPGSFAFNPDGDDGVTITDEQVSAPGLEVYKQGVWALEKAELFNLLCIPPFSFDATGNVGTRTRTVATNYCRARYAFYIVDPFTAWNDLSDLTARVNSLDSIAWELNNNENIAT